MPLIPRINHEKGKRNEGPQNGLPTSPKNVKHYAKLLFYNLLYNGKNPLLGNVIILYTTRLCWNWKLCTSGEGNVREKIS